MQKELKQGKPFVSRQSEAVIGILRTAQVVEDVLSAFLKAHGLTHTQYNALRIIRGAGPEGLPCKEIGARLIQRVPDVTRLLDRLEREGWIDRHRSAEDRRVVRIAITAAGRKMIDPMDGPIDRVAVDLLQGMSAAKVRELIDLLARVRAGA